VLCLLIVRHDASFVPSEALVRQIQAWNEEMTRAGVRRDGRPLRPPEEALTVRVRDGAPLVTGGPGSTTEAAVAAYELIECADLEEAAAIAATHPMASAGVIEVRPVWDELMAPSGGGSSAGEAAEAERGCRGRVVWSATMSLDGFIAGPGDAMGWAFDHSGCDPAADEAVRRTGAVLAGRRSYDVGRRGERPQVRAPFGGGWSGAQFVLSHRPHDPDPDHAFLDGDIRDAVAIALEAAAGKDLNVIGADVARQCLAAGLIDEVVVFLAPVLLGDGVRLVSRLETAPVELELVDVSRAGGVTNLRFRVLK
jgi:dihydrofolate reductase